MITPVYFPFTTISEPLFGALAACFGKVVVYHPSRQHVPQTLRSWENDGRLEIRLPAEEDSGPLVDLLKAYRRWADLHLGEHPDFEKFHPSRIPFFEETAPSRIRSDIRAAAKGNSTHAEAPSDLFKAMLFLILAQEHDQHRISLQEDLEKIDHMEKILFQDLKSEQEPPHRRHPGDSPGNTDKADSHMHDERLAAWVCLYAHHKRIAGSGLPATESPDLFITSIPSVLEKIAEQNAEPELICAVSGIPFRNRADVPPDGAFNDRLDMTLRQATGAKAPSSVETISFPDAGVGDTGALSIYRVKGNFMAGLCTLSEGFPVPSSMLQSITEKPYALVGLLAANA